MKVIQLLVKRGFKPDIARYGDYRSSPPPPSLSLSLSLFPSLSRRASHDDRDESLTNQRA